MNFILIVQLLVCLHVFVAHTTETEKDKRHVGLVGPPLILAPPFLSHPPIITLPSSPVYHYSKYAKYLPPSRPSYLPPHEPEDDYRYPAPQCPVHDDENKDPEDSPDHCDVTCSHDSDCNRVGEKCCKTPGCGWQCVVGVHPRPGRCPRKDTTVCGLKHVCQYDGECPWGNKCCNDQCGNKGCVNVYLRN